MLTALFLTASPVFAGPNLLLITVDDMNCDSVGVCQAYRV